MKLTIEQALQQGVAAHKEGRLQEAERLYHAILQAQPAHPDANHNLGVIAVSVNKAEAALPFFKTALEANPKIEQFWLSYIDALIREKQFENAKQVLEQGKKQGVAGDKFDALEDRLKQIAQSKLPEKKNRLTLKEKRKKISEGKQKKKKTSSKNANAEAHYNLGNKLKGLGSSKDAEASYRKAIALKPDYAKAHSNLGITLQELGRLEEAEASYTKAIALKPDYAEAHGNLGDTLQEFGRLEEAEESYRKTIALKPDFAKAHNNLGNTLKALGRLEEAEASYRQAIALKPNYVIARYNLGVLLFGTMEYDMAAEQFGLVDIHQSKSYGIRCSYLQDEETVFYEKLKALIDRGERDAVIGSLSCSAEIRYGVRKPNPFCNEPLKYVVKTDLNERYDFENIFAKTARDILTDKSVSYRAQGHLTNGSQTAGNFFAMKKVFITEIESIIRAEIEKYRVNFEDSEEGFIKNWPTSYGIYGWLVRMQSGGELAAHMHDDGWITGSVYINVPPKSKTNSGNLVLCVGDQKNVLGADKSQESIIDVVTGSLCFFPSSLRHYTVPFEEEENRIVLAFDVVPA